MFNRFSLVIVVGIAAFLRFYDLDRAGLGNLFYAATVRSMIESVHNFFFVAYDPFGAFMVDKPPLALWIQASMAKVIGFGGDAMLFPMAFSGTLAVVLTFFAARFFLGSKFALLAALILAIFPESVATSRDSTMDSMMMVFLLASTIAAQIAVRNKSRIWLITCAFLMGLVFNIKFIEGFVAIPAFVALLIVGWPSLLKSHFKTLVLSLFVFSFISLAWITSVDLVNRESRPVVMNDTNNSAYSLVWNYNGLDRVLHRTIPIFQPANGGTGNNPTVPVFGIGDAGPFRLVSGLNAPLMGTTIALAFLGVFLALRRAFRPKPFALFWAIWGISGFLLFSFSNRAAAHYTESYAPALAVLAAAGAAWLLTTGSRAGQLIRIFIIGAIAFYSQFVFDSFLPLATPTLIVAVLALVSSLCASAFILINSSKNLTRLLIALATFCLIAIPAIPSWWIAFEAPRGHVIAPPNPLIQAKDEGEFSLYPSSDAEELISFASAESKTPYVIGVDGFNRAGEFFSMYGEPALPIWGEYTREALFSPSELTKLIADGEVRFLLIDSRRNSKLLGELGTWIRHNCSDVTRLAIEKRGRNSLYDCNGVTLEKS